MFLLAALLAGAPVLAGAPAGDEPPGPALEPILQLPLADGRFDLAEALRGTLVEAGQDPPAFIEDCSWPVDVRSTLGRAQLETIRRMSGGSLVIEITADRVTVRGDRQWIARSGDAVAGAAEERMQRLLALLRPEARAFGTTFVTDDDPHRPAAARLAEGPAPPRVVLLVHGLDDPGWMWRDVIAALREAGFVVARFEYPNDGPIADAADLLAWSLLELRAAGVVRIDLVVHSMGGLVSRDVLTRRAYYDGDGGGGERFPRIERLIMCGTPNHGSEMARLRGLAEIKEQITRVFSGQGAWLGGLADGQGEAAIDLLPGSAFLRALNARPLATSTRHTIIAGRLSPVTEKEIERVGASVRSAARRANAPTWLLDAIDRAEGEASGVLEAAVRGVGDGCVTIDSARLEGVDDFVIVEANHVSMIVNFAPSDRVVPPAIPVILQRLGPAPQSTARDHLSPAPSRP